MKVIALNIIGVVLIVGLVYIPTFNKTVSPESQQMVFEGEEVDEPPIEKDQEPLAIQIIYAIGDNFTKIMAGLLTLTQVLLNFKTLKNKLRKNALLKR